MRTVNIGRLVDPVMKWNPRKDGAGPFTYIDISSIDQSTKAVAECAKVEAAEAPSRARQLVAAGDVLVSTVRPNLNAVAYIRSDLDGATASTGFCVLRPRPGELDGRYLYHWVQTPPFVDHLVRLATGASYPAVSDKIVKSTSIPLPTIGEQRRIAAALDAVEALQAKRREALAKLDLLVQSIFLEMFDVAETETVEIGRVVDSIRKWDPRKDEVTKFKYVDISSIDQAAKIISTATEIESSEAPSRARQLVSTGDILVSTVRPNLNAVAYVPPELEGATASTGICVLRPRPDHIDWRYLYHWVQTNHFVGHLTQRATGASYPAVSDKIVKASPIPLPPMEQQRRFRQLVDSVEKLRDKFRLALAEVKMLNSSLQQRAFRGEL